MRRYRTIEQIEKSLIDLGVPEHVVEKHIERLMQVRLHEPPARVRTRTAFVRSAFLDGIKRTQKRPTPPITLPKVSALVQR